MIENATRAHAPAIADPARPVRPQWRVSYPADWPPDPEPDNLAVSWSRHWAPAGVFNPRCPRCRALGEACEDAGA